MSATPDRDFSEGLIRVWPCLSVRSLSTPVFRFDAKMRDRVSGEGGGTAGRTGSSPTRPVANAFPLSTGHKTGLIVFLLTPDCNLAPYEERRWPKYIPPRLKTLSPLASVEKIASRPMQSTMSNPPKTSPRSTSSLRISTRRLSLGASSCTLTRVLSWTILG